jgi:hypothetical protein
MSLGPFLSVAAHILHGKRSVLIETNRAPDLFSSGDESCGGAGFVHSGDESCGGEF